MVKLSGTSKKGWSTVFASNEFKQKEIGDLPGDNLNGKNIVVNLGMLLEDIKKQNAKVIFNISDVKDGKAYTKLTAYELSSSFIRRMVRKDISKIDMSFPYQCKDGKLIIKPIMITRKKVNRSVLSGLRKTVVEQVTEKLKEKTCSEAFLEIISNRLQSQIKSSIAKVYPLIMFDFRMVVLTS